jgi:hypothetical protein
MFMSFGDFPSFVSTTVISIGRRRYQAFAVKHLGSGRNDRAVWGGGWGAKYEKRQSLSKVAKYKKKYVKA